MFEGSRRSRAPQRPDAMGALLGGKTMPDLSKPRPGAAPRPASTRPASLGRPTRELPPNVRDTLSKLKAEFQRRTGGGNFKSMMRTLRTYDDDRNGRLSYEEFFDILENLHLVEVPPTGPAALGGLGQPSRRFLQTADKAAHRGTPVGGPTFGRTVQSPTKSTSSGPTRPITRDEAHGLFEVLDSDSSGSIDIPEFMEIVAPPMSDRRIALLRLAFSALDTDGSGVATISEMAEKYDFSAHPQVRSGQKTRDDLLREFMEVWWDSDGDGNITFKEFEKYYRKIGVTIDSDEYFEAMIRNAWKIAGGTGQSACSTAVQAVVWKIDGTTETVEVKNSLGLKKWDSKELEKRLLRQGVKGMKRAEVLGIRTDQEI